MELPDFSELFSNSKKDFVIFLVSKGYLNIKDEWRAYFQDKAEAERQSRLVQDTIRQSLIYELR